MIVDINSNSGSTLNYNVIICELCVQSLLISVNNMWKTIAKNI